MKPLFKTGIALLSAATLIIACNNSETPTSVANNCIDTTNFDMSVRPQDDFYEYVNGNWIKKNPIPSSETAWGNFNVLSEKSRKDLREICEDAAKSSNTQGSNAQKIGDFYSAGMDSNAVEAAKFSPIQSYLDQINAIKTPADVSAMIGTMHTMQMFAGFGSTVMADMKDSKVNAFYLFQSGTSLPEKDYYFNPDFKGLVDAYHTHLVNMFKLMGDDEASAGKNADATLKIERMFADSSMGAIELRDQEKQYNKMSVADLQKLTPDFNWSSYFSTIGAQNVNEVIVAQPHFMWQFNKMLKAVSIDEWKAYLRFNLVHACAPKMHKAVCDENFSFFGKTLSGAPQDQPRWKKVLAVTEGALGEALGQLYVAKHFSQAAKDRVNEMVSNLIAAYTERIKSRTWMGDSTKIAAQAKLDHILRKLGFPDKWRDYSGLDVTKESYLKNYLASNKFDMSYNLGKLAKPVDRMEWGMTPATINAYYNPSNNEIVFPAAIMQPPFFDTTADDAVNYGAMGAIIGHELTHGFDDQGSMFDSEGNMKNWWSESDKANFKEKTSALAKQFDQFVAVDSMNLHVQGDLTLGENIADLGGLTIAYYAYKKSLEGKPAPEKINGFTGEQRFFISWAQGWRNSQRTQALINQVKTNPHSPAKFRVLGPLSNLSEFYDAFGVKEGDKMYRKPEDRVLIW
ncbi:MAG TPA: M13 family metallopeptidase [Bacteroidia bacterium]|jgi:putative endopeptidase|nr:M13 family metallopeptidase [Bacteroidia bacterium]